MPTYPGAPSNMTSTVVNVNVQQKGPGLLIRAIYFLFIGWWLGYFWLWLGFFLCGLIVTLPLGLAVLNRLPQVLTLRPAGTDAQTSVAVSTTTMAASPAIPGTPGAMTMAQTVNVNVTVGGTRQINFLVRILYFLFIGWWVGLFWANLGYALCLLIVTLPVGLMMLNRLPMVLTLRKN